MSHLPENLQRTSEGHLSEIALSTLADGEDAALAPTSLAHVDECEVCQGRLADAILEHTRVADAMVAVGARVPAPVRTPWAWIAGAAVFALGLRGAELVDAMGRGGVVQHVRHARRASSLVWRGLLAQSSWMVGLCCIAVAVVLVTALAHWVAPPRERV